MLDASPVTVTGDDDPVNVAGEVVGDGVTIKLVGAPPLVFGENATVILPSLKDLPDGVFVAVAPVGANGAAAIGNHPLDV